MSTLLEEKIGEKHSPAAETIASNVDLLIEILLRVPAKPLMKFKCVSNDWFSLISDPQFGRNHTRHNPTPLVSGIYLPYLGPHDDMYINYAGVKPIPIGHGTSLPSFYLLRRVAAFQITRSPSSDSEVLQFANGLVLCCHGSARYTISNLTTEKFRPLPSLSPCFQDSSYQPYLIYDPARSPYYKVVCVSHSCSRTASQLAIYSSQCTSWRYTSLELLKQSIHGLILHRGNLGVILNEAIIWRSFMSREHVFFRLDVDTEKLTVTRVPADPRILKKILYFGECGGRLLHSHLGAKYVMNFIEYDDDFHWIVKYQLDVTQTPSIVLDRFGRLTVSVISVVKRRKRK